MSGDKGTLKLARGLCGVTCGLDSLSRACVMATDSLIYFAWAMPGKWPDPFVILKRGDRTGRRELPFGGDLWTTYPRPID